jgi:arylsulfatase A-like enzyme
MNFIVLMCDTFRRDHLGCYGNGAVRTPNLDRLAQESVVFDQAFSCSFPTLPCRAELFTGKFVFPYLDWGPLPRSELLLSETLARHNYTCAMVTDNFQLCKPGYDYERGFHSRIRVRGQGYEPVVPKDTPFEWPCPKEKLKSPERTEQYLRNISLREREEDWFAPRVMSGAMEWLEREHRYGKFFLWVDCFDPHEPWDPPQSYTDLYNPGYSGDAVTMPHYGPCSGYTDAEMNHIRALYKGEVSLVDTWIGKLLDRVDALGLREETTVVMLSDHGIYLGDRGLIGKMEGRANENGRPIGWPTYPELSSIPMIWRVPGLTPGRRSAFIHPGDLSATLLDLAGIEAPPSFRTRSAARVLRGQDEKIRDVAVSSWSLRNVNARRPSTIRTEEWSLAFWRGDIEPEVYHRKTDPMERTNVYRGEKGVARELHARYLQFLREQDTPLKNLLPRLWHIPLSRPAKAELATAGG